MVQALEQTAREILTLLQGVHQGAGFQDSESRLQPAVAPRSAFPGRAGKSRLGGRGSAPRGTRLPLSRAPLFQVSVARGRSWGVLRGLLRGCCGRGGSGWEVSSQISRKAAIHPLETPFFPFLPSLSWCFTVSVQKSVFFLQVFTFWVVELAHRFPSHVDFYILLILPSPVGPLYLYPLPQLFTPPPKKL